MELSKVVDGWYDLIKQKDTRARGHCFYCGVFISKDGSRYSPTSYTKDHVYAKSKHGPGHKLPCCYNCNQKKGSKSITEFRHQRKAPFYGEMTLRVKLEDSPNRLAVDLETLIRRSFNRTMARIENIFNRNIKK